MHKNNEYGVLFNIYFVNLLLFFKLNVKLVGFFNWCLIACFYVKLWLIKPLKMKFKKIKHR